MNKRGVFFFVIDVIIALLIFTITVLVLASFFAPRNAIGGAEQYANVMQEDIFNQRVGDLTPDVRRYVPEKYNFDSLRIDELLYLIVNDTDLDSENATTIFLAMAEVIPEQYGVALTIEGGSYTIIRPSSRVLTISEADVVISRKTLTLPSPKYCSTVCLITETEVLVWS